MNKAYRVFAIVFTILLSCGCVDKTIDVPVIDDEEIEVSLNPAQNVTWGSVTLTGKSILKKGSVTMIQYGVEYWEEGKEHTGKDFGRRELQETFSFELNGLTPETSYHCRLFVGKFYSNEITFKTERYPVESISLNETDISLYEGESYELVASIQPSVLTDRSISWSSSDPSVVSVSDAGIIEAKKGGSAVITAKVEEKEAQCNVTVKTVEFSIGMSQITLTVGSVVGIQAEVKPSALDVRNAQWSSSNEEVAFYDRGVILCIAPGECIITASFMSKTAECKVTVVDYTFTAEPVDLGLSVYWSTVNLGAAIPTQYGAYYAWGETEPKRGGSWETYKWIESEPKNPLNITKYTVADKKVDALWYDNVGNFVGDNKRTLDLEDDAAHVKLGGKWRMPTKDEFQELIDYCSWAYVYNFEGSGIRGYVVTSRIKDYNDKSIFIPTSAYPNDGDYSVSQYGSHGFYHSSSLGYSDTYLSYALRLVSTYSLYMNQMYRYYCFSIRPVMEKGE